MNPSDLINRCVVIIEKEIKNIESKGELETDDCTKLMGYVRALIAIEKTVEDDLPSDQNEIEEAFLIEAEKILSKRKQQTK